MRLSRTHSDNEPEGLSELSEVLDALPELVATFDRDGRLLWMNVAGIDLLGYNEQNLDGLLLSDLYPELEAEQVIDDALKQAIARGSWNGVAPLVTSNKTRIDTRQRWVAHEPRTGKTLAFTLVARPVQDMNDIELRNRRECLVAATLGLVHDMNNCLGPVTAYADLAATVLDADSPAQNYAAQILRAAERCSSLSSRLSDLSRAREPELTSVDIAAIAREISGWLRVMRPDLKIELEIPNVTTTVTGDPVQLHQVVMNLAKNGIEALSDRSGSIHIRIDHANPPYGDVRQGGYLRLEVRDDGRGIVEEAEARVFEPFFSTRPGGSGLGLAVSRAIVQAHDGRINIERAEPKGTVATVFLPLESP